MIQFVDSVRACGREPGVVHTICTWVQGLGFREFAGSHTLRTRGHHPHVCAYERVANGSHTIRVRIAHRTHTWTQQVRVCVYELALAQAHEHKQACAYLQAWIGIVHKHEGMQQNVRAHECTAHTMCT